VSYEGFVANVLAAFNKGGAIATNATCKLMGMEFLYFLLSIKENQMAGLITDMAFLAQKKKHKSLRYFWPIHKDFINEFHRIFNRRQRRCQSAP
jgi:hypothetical protein